MSMGKIKLKVMVYLIVIFDNGYKLTPSRSLISVFVGLWSIA